MIDLFNYTGVLKFKYIQIKIIFKILIVLIYKGNFKGNLIKIY